jgi:hypothetical protein
MATMPMGSVEMQPKMAEGASLFRPTLAVNWCFGAAARWVSLRSPVLRAWLNGWWLDVGAADDRGG